MDLTASSAVSLPMSSASLRLVVIWVGIRSIRCTYSGTRKPLRFTFTTNLMFIVFSHFLGTEIEVTDIKGGDLSRLPFLSLGTVLGGLARSLGFEGLLAANINLDLLGLRFRLLGQIHLQHALIIMGAHLSWIHRAGQSKRASEASVLALDATI